MSCDLRLIKAKKKAVGPSTGAGKCKKLKLRETRLLSAQ